MKNVDGESLLSLGEVQAFVKLSATTIKKLVSQDDFPKPVHFTPRKKHWIQTEVKGWVDEKLRR